LSCKKAGGQGNPGNKSHKPNPTKDMSLHKLTSPFG
jgi:hypothetical protein